MRASTATYTFRDVKACSSTRSKKSSRRAGFAKVSATFGKSSNLPREQLVAVDIVKLREPNDCFFYQVIRAGSSGCETYDDWPFWQPVLRHDLALFMEV